MKREEIKKLIEEILSLMQVAIEELTVVFDENKKTDIFTVRVADPDALIGRDGERFLAFIHLIKRMANKNEEEKDKEGAYKFSIDVNNYQKSLTDKLRNKALILANQARDFKKDIELEPMSPYERMIVHDTLSGQSQIKTESTGWGKERRVVIKYTPD